MKQMLKKGFDSATQDKVLRLLLMDTKFVQNVRHFLRPQYFSSEILRKLSQGVFDFYDTYAVAPNFEQLDGIFASMVESNQISEDEIDVYLSYVDRLMFDVKTDLVVKEFLTDNLMEFAKRSVVDALVKAVEKERKAGKDSNALYKYVMAAVEEFSSITSGSTVVAFSDVPLDVGSDVVSCFNVPPIDDQLGGGLQRGLFYIVLGYTGAGKTWTLVHLGKMAVRFGFLVLHVVVEISNKVVKKRYRMAMSGKSVKELSREYKYVGEMVKKSMVKKSNILFVDEEEKSESVDSLKKVVNDVVRKYGRKPDIILIDSAEDYTPPTGKKYSDKFDAIEATFMYCKNFARENDVAVVTTVQAVRKGETSRWLTSHSVAGYIAKARKAIVGISINGYPVEKAEGFYRLLVFKNSEGEEGAKAWVKRDLKHGQMVLESGYMDSEYWDQFEWGKE